MKRLEMFPEDVKPSDRLPPNYNVGASVAIIVIGLVVGTLIGLDILSIYLRRKGYNVHQRKEAKPKKVQPRKRRMRRRHQPNEILDDRGEP